MLAMRTGHISWMNQLTNSRLFHSLVCPTPTRPSTPLDAFAIQATVAACAGYIPGGATGSYVQEKFICSLIWAASNIGLLAIFGGFG